MKEFNPSECYVSRPATKEAAGMDWEDVEVKLTRPCETEVAGRRFSLAAHLLVVGMIQAANLSSKKAMGELIGWKGQKDIQSKAISIG
jgi:hypothetical protein